jgi:hypothetical protein
MKHLIKLSAFVVLFFFGCKKDKTIPGTSANSNPFFDSAVQYLKSNLLQNEFDKLDFTRSKTLMYKNQNFGVQVFEKGENDDKFLLLQRKKEIYSGNWVDMSGLAKTRAHLNSGNIMLTSLENNSVTKLAVVNNEVTGTEKTGNNTLSLETQPTVLPEVIVYYDVNGGGIDYFSWYWLLDQTSSTTYDYFNAGGGSASGGSGYSSVAVAPIVTAPDTPILDLSKEVKCFTNSSTSTYNISVNVNEPDPETRDVVNPLSSFPVGHTFLTLEQHNADGTSVIRTLGFYPMHSVKPGSETDQSIFGDDSYTPYDVSLDFTVTGAEMSKVIGKLLDQQALQYDLNNFNCTNSPMEGLKSININLPSTKSTEPFFSGNDPGDLGEDIRGLNLNDFSAQNGNRKITRMVSNYDNLYSKGRAGSCP